MDNDDFYYDLKQNIKYNIFAFLIAIICFILLVQFISIISNIINHLKNNEILFNHSLLYYISFFLLLIILIIIIIVVKKLKLSNTKYYSFKFDNNIDLKKFENSLIIAEDRKIIDEISFIKRIKLDKNDTSIYRLLCYKANNFDKKEFDKQKNDIHNRFNKKYDIHFIRNDPKLEHGVRINMIFTKSFNKSLEEYMSLHATGLNSLIYSVNVAIVGNTMYVQPIKQFIIFPISKYYFGTIKKFYNFLRNI